METTSTKPSATSGKLPCIIHIWQYQLALNYRSEASVAVVNPASIEVCVNFYSMGVVETSIGVVEISMAIVEGSMDGVEAYMEGSIYIDEKNKAL